MRLLPKRLTTAIAGAFGRRGPRTLPGFPLELLAQRKDLWVQLLRDAMQRSGKGFRTPSMKRRPPAGASKWRGARRPDKVEAAERNAVNLCFHGKLNYRRSDRVQAPAVAP